MYQLFEFLWKMYLKVSSIVCFLNKLEYQRSPVSQTRSSLILSSEENSWKFSACHSFSVRWSIICKYWKFPGLTFTLFSRFEQLAAPLWLRPCYMHYTTTNIMLLCHVPFLIWRFVIIAQKISLFLFFCLTFRSYCCDSTPFISNNSQGSNDPAGTYLSITARYNYNDLCAYRDVVFCMTEYNII